MVKQRRDFYRKRKQPLSDSPTREVLAKWEKARLEEVLAIGAQPVFYRYDTMELAEQALYDLRVVRHPELYKDVVTPDKYVCNIFPKSINLQWSEGQRGADGSDYVCWGVSIDQFQRYTGVSTDKPSTAERRRQRHQQQQQHQQRQPSIVGCFFAGIFRKKKNFEISQWPPSTVPSSVGVIGSSVGGFDGDAKVLFCFYTKTHAHFYSDSYLPASVVYDYFDEIQ
jgi:hypothetical protein